MRNFLRQCFDSPEQIFFARHARDLIADLAVLEKSSVERHEY